MIRLLCLVVGYFFGAFQTAYFYGKMHGIDIRTMGSGNAGTTNTLRVLGTKAGLIVLAGDVIKTMLAIAVARYLIVPRAVDPNMEYLLILYTAAGAILADVWIDDITMPVIDCLGQEFLDYVKDGMLIKVLEDGTVLIKE